MGDIHGVGGPARRGLMLRAARTAVLLSVLFVVIYGGTNWLTARRPAASLGQRSNCRWQPSSRSGVGAKAGVAGGERRRATAASKCRAVREASARGHPVGRPGPLVPARRAVAIIALAGHTAPAVPWRWTGPGGSRGLQNRCAAL